MLQKDLMHLHRAMIWSTFRSCVELRVHTEAGYLITFNVLFAHQCHCLSQSHRYSAGHSMLTWRNHQPLLLHLHLLSPLCLSPIAAQPLSRGHSTPRSLRLRTTASLNLLCCFCRRMSPVVAQDHAPTVPTLGNQEGAGNEKPHPRVPTPRQIHRQQTETSAQVLSPHVSLPL